MKYNNQNDKQGPEQWGQTGQVMSVLVNGDRIDVLRRRNVHLVYMQRMLQLVYMISVRGNVQDGCDGVGEFHRKLFPLLWPQLYGRINAAGVARKKLLLPIDELIEGHVKLRVVVVAHLHLNTQQWQVRIVQMAKLVVAVQLPRIQVQVEVVVSKLEAANAEHNGLQYAVHAQLVQVAAAVLLQGEQPQRVGLARLRLVPRQLPQFFCLQCVEALVAAFHVIAQFVGLNSAR